MGPLRRITTRVLAKPFIQVLLYEGIIPQMRIRFAHAVDFFHLARGEFLMGIKTPAAFQQALTPQDLMYARNTSTKLVSGIKYSRVRVGNLLGKCELFAEDSAGIACCHRKVRNRGVCPHCPMP